MRETIITCLLASIVLGPLAFLAVDDIGGSDTYAQGNVTALVTTGDKNGIPHFYVYYNANGHGDADEADSLTYFQYKVGDSIKIRLHKHRFTNYVRYSAPWVNN